MECHHCHRAVPTHAEGCRVLNDLKLFERVYNRLCAEHRNETLQQSLLRYLRLNGRSEAAAAF